MPAGLSTGERQSQVRSDPRGESVGHHLFLHTAVGTRALTCGIAAWIVAQRRSR